MVRDPLAEENPDRAPRHDYSMLFAILDDYLRDCEKKGKKKEIARLDEVLYALYSDMSAIHQILALIRLRRPYAGRRDFDAVKRSESERAWTYINKHFLEQSPWRYIRPGSDGKWEEVHTIVNREKGSEKIKAEQHLAELLTKFLDLPPPKGPQVS